MAPKMKGKIYTQRRISGSLYPLFRRARTRTTQSDREPTPILLLLDEKQNRHRISDNELTHPRKFPTKAARKINPVDPALQLYGFSVMISEMVLNETIPAVHPKANWMPARTIFG